MLHIGSVLNIKGKKYVLVEDANGRRPKVCLESDPTKVFTMAMKADLRALDTGEINTDVLNKYFEQSKSKKDLIRQLKAGDKFFGKDGKTYTFFDYTGTNVRHYDENGVTYKAKPGFIEGRA
jgi:hypothetical protein